MSGIALLGGGGHASDVLSVVEALHANNIQLFDPVYVADDSWEQPERFDDRIELKMIESIEAGARLAPFVVAVGYPGGRRAVHDVAVAQGASPHEPLVHPDSSDDPATPVPHPTLTDGGALHPETAASTALLTATGATGWSDRPNGNSATLPTPIQATHCIAPLRAVKHRAALLYLERTTKSSAIGDRQGSSTPTARRKLRTTRPFPHFIPTHQALSLPFMVPATTLTARQGFGPFVRLFGAIWCLSTPWTALYPIAYITGAGFFTGAVLLYPGCVNRRVLAPVAVILSLIAASEYHAAGLTAALGIEVAVALLAVLPATVAAVMERPGPLNGPTWFIAGALTSAVVGLLGPKSAAGAVVGFSFHRNQFAICSAAAILVLIGTRRTSRPVTGAIVAVLLAGIVLSGSRSGVAALLVGGILMVVPWVKERPRRLLPLMCGVAAAWMIAGLASGLVAGSEGERLIDREATAQSDEGRVELANVAVEHLSPSSLLIGDGLVFDGKSPHNIFLELLVVGGGGAIAAGTLIAVRPVWQIARLQEGMPPEWRAWSAAVAAIFVALLVNNAMWAPFLWLCIGFQETHRQRSDDLPRKPKPRARRLSTV